ncbi:GNAT family N-acetyltransferase [Pontibacter toksunensis]|uniref:GNAT family N-acetyltransferase n=1 Tax=Pontibacter toksunensis TaxID=1332631 RepID=A0ABW6BTP6_9BACT
MIKEADPDDIDDVFELWRELLDFHQPYHPIFKYKPNSEQEQKKELLVRLKDKDTRFFGYVQEDEWQGMIIASLKQAAPGFKLSKKGYIAETVVKAHYRGTGIGNELFEAAKNWLIDKGADHIELQVSVKNTAAIKFWEVQGFTPSTHHMVLDVSSKAKKS